MLKKIALAVVAVSIMGGCTALKKRFGTGEETPELIAARKECRTQAEKEAVAKYESTISQKEYTRKAFDACMERKGYDKFGKKIK